MIKKIDTYGVLFVTCLSLSMVAPIVLYFNIISNFNYGDLLFLLFGFIAFWRNQLILLSRLLLVSAFISVVIISLSLNVLFSDLSVTVDVGIIFRYFYYLLIMIIISSYVVKTQKVEDILRSIHYGLIMTAMICVYEWSKTPVYLGSIPMFHTVHQFSSFPINRNYFGFFISIGCTLSFVFLMYAKNKLFNFLSFSLFSVLSVLSFSKGTWLSSFLPVLSLTFYLMSRAKSLKNRVASIIALFLAFGSFVSVYLLTDLSEKIENRFSNSASTNSERYSYVLDALEIINQSPLLGIGVGNYGEATKYFNLHSTKDPHNTLLWIWSESGVFALIIFIIICVLCLKYVLPLSNDLNRVAVFFTTIAIILSMPTQGTPLTMKYLWVLISLSYSIKYLYFRQWK